MTDTYQPLRDRAARGRSPIPDWVIAAEMDRMVHIKEQAQRTIDSLAAETGWDRVSIENVHIGDVIGGYEWRQVATVGVRSIESGHHFFRVTYTDGSPADEFAPDDMVSRQLPLPPEGF